MRARLNVRDDQRHSVSSLLQPVSEDLAPHRHVPEPLRAAMLLVIISTWRDVQHRLRAIVHRRPQRRVLRAVVVAMAGTAAAIAAATVRIHPRLTLHLLT